MIETGKSKEMDGVGQLPTSSFRVSPFYSVHSVVLPEETTECTEHTEKEEAEESHRRREPKIQRDRIVVRQWSSVVIDEITDGVRLRAGSYFDSMSGEPVEST